MRWPTSRIAPLHDENHDRHERYELHALLQAHGSIGSHVFNTIQVLPDYDPLQLPAPSIGFRKQQINPFDIYDIAFCRQPPDSQLAGISRNRNL